MLLFGPIISGVQYRIFPVVYLFTQCGVLALQIGDASIRRCLSIAHSFTPLRRSRCARSSCVMYSRR